MRNFPFISVGKLMEELQQMGLTINRVTFYRREADIPDFPKVQTKPNDWRRYSRAEADTIIQLLKKYYKLT